LIRLATLLLGALLIGGCSTPGSDVPSGSTGATVSSAPARAPAIHPASIRIPAIGVMSSLVPLGLTETGELAVPPVDRPGQAGYYAGAKLDVDGDEILPGVRGSAVIAAHVNGEVNGVRGQPGLFFRLHELVPGDEVQIERDDGVTLQFVVTEVRRYPKSALDHAAVYGRVDKPRLNLITCTGPFQRDVRSYRDNLVVFTELVG
jgi:hypothetical protein